MAKRISKKLKDGIMLSDLPPGICGRWACYRTNHPEQDTMHAVVDYWVDGSEQIETRHFVGKDSGFRATDFMLNITSSLTCVIGLKILTDDCPDVLALAVKLLNARPKGD